LNKIAFQSNRAVRLQATSYTEELYSKLIIIIIIIIINENDYGGVKSKDFKDT